MSAVDKQGMIEYPFSYQTVFRATTQSLPLIKGMTMGHADEMNGYILVSVGISWASWGENIRIDFVKLGPTRTQMIVKSSASVSTTLVDYGKNKKNVNRIISAVSTTLANYPPEAISNDMVPPVPETGQQLNQMPPQAYQQPQQQVYQQPQQPQYQQPYQQPQYQQTQQQAYQQPQQAYQQPYQQQAYQQPQPPMRPENNMVWAILSTIFCCLPLGIIAIVFSNKVNTLYNSGDFAGAEEAADNAKKYAIMAAVCGLAFSSIGILAIVINNL